MQAVRLRTNHGQNVMAQESDAQQDSQQLETTPMSEIRGGKDERRKGGSRRGGGEVQRNENTVEPGAARRPTGAASAGNSGNVFTRVVPLPYTEIRAPSAAAPSCPRARAQVALLSATTSYRYVRINLAASETAVRAGADSTNKSQASRRQERLLL